LDNISKNIEKDTDTHELIMKHIDILSKMRRRLKHIIDVSDKYAVENVFEGINLLREMSEAMEMVPPSNKVKMGKCKSMYSLHKIKKESQASIGSESDMKENNPEGLNVLKKSVKGTL
jgi:hypothetical protein